MVEGQELEDVAAYVGKWAGVPGAAPPKVPGGPGAQVFANNGCGGCHTLAAAKSGGTVGPNLDEVLSGQSAAMIEESIVDPNAKIATGYPANVMPLNFGETLSPERTRRPGPVPDPKKRAAKAPRRQGREGPPDRSPRAAEPPSQRPLAAVGIIRLAMRERLSLKITPQLYAKVTAGRPRRRWR